MPRTAKNELSKESLVDDSHLPMYELDDSQIVTKTVCAVQRDPQLAALHSLAGNGPVEPDGWVKGYNGQSVPVVDGVPITLIESTLPEGATIEGTESVQKYEIDSVGVVEIHHAGRHPTNTSKIKVEAK